MTKVVENQNAAPPETAFADWNASLADLIAALGQEGFALALRRALSLCAGFDSLMITRYRGTSEPVCLFHDLDDVQAAISVSFHATGPFLLDPFYLACRDGRAPGAYRLCDLVPASFLLSEYYRRFYRRVRIRDELGLLLPDGPEGWIILSLARGLRSPSFDAASLGRVRASLPPLAALVARHWGASGRAGGAEVRPTRAQDLLGFLGGVSLSPREAEIIHLVLQGHSSPTIAASLGLAEGTVKVHRRNAYAKLGISSQGELFSMATRYLVSDPD